MKRYHIHLEGELYIGPDVKSKCHTMKDAVEEAFRLHLLFDGNKSVSVWDDVEQRYFVDKPGKRAPMGMK